MVAVDDATAREIERFAFTYGQTYDSYLAADLRSEYFWSSGRRGLVAYARFNRHLVAIGGLMAPPEHLPELTREFLAFGRARRCTVSFFNVTPAHAPVLRDAGFEVSKIGEDATIDLRASTWSGKSFEWLRRQSNFCQRQGLECVEIRRQDLSADEWAAQSAELTEVSRQFLATKPQGGSMANFVSQFDPSRLHRQRVFAARAEHGRGRVEAFCVSNPARDGALWSIEVFRGRTDAVRGSVAFVMFQALRLLQADGVPQASLCLVPMIRTDRPVDGDSALVRRLSRWAYNYAGPLYEIPGMFHFKSRFRPAFEDRFLCVWPRASLLSLRAMVALWRLDHVRPWRVAGRVITMWRKKDRRTLASPEM